MNDQWEHPADRRHRMAKELDLFRGLKRRAAGLPEADDRSEHQKAMDQARSDAERRKPRS